VQLLREGGYTVRDEVDPAHAPGVFDRVLMAIGLKAEVTKKVLRDAQGKPVTIEFLIEEASFQPHHMPFIKNLAILGIEATLRLVEGAQMQVRRNDFDLIRYSAFKHARRFAAPYFCRGAKLPVCRTCGCGPGHRCHDRAIIAAKNGGAHDGVSRSTASFVRGAIDSHWYWSHWVAYWMVQPSAAEAEI
jgi:hypothetical protein